MIDARPSRLALTLFWGAAAALLAASSTSFSAARAAEPPAVGSAVVVDLLGLPPPPEVAALPPPTERARTTYAQRCTHCHGPSGRGDGPLAATLVPPPRNFTDRAWQAVTTDEAMADAIRQGGAALKKSPLMPAHPDLDAAALAALVHLLRSFPEPAVASVRVSLERVDAPGRDASSTSTLVGEKRLRLRTGALRARFDSVPPGKVRVRGFVDLDGDGHHAKSGSEPAFVGPILDVGAAEVRSTIAVDAPPTPGPSEPRDAP